MLVRLRVRRRVLREVCSRARSLSTAFLKDESGQGTIEYILLLSFAVSGAMLFVRTTLGVLDRGIGFLGGHLEKDLKTGKVGASVWVN